MKNIRINLYSNIIKYLFYAQIGAIIILLVISGMIITGTFKHQTVKLESPLISGNFSTKFTKKAADFLEQDSRPEIKSLGNGSVFSQFKRTSYKRFFLYRYLCYSFWLGISLFITFFLKKIMETLKEGNPFTETNVKNIRKIAKIIMWVGPLKYIISQIETMIFFRAFVWVPNIRFYEMFFYGIATLFIGYAIIVLAEVFNEGNQLKAEQQLTI